MKVEYIKINNREKRARYLADNFSGLLDGSVLDVGCSDALLKDRIPEDVRYVGVDLYGQPHVKIDMERVSYLPFPDCTFDTVVCTDVLEHLDNFHHVFKEIIRVSARHMIISLPNNWNNLRNLIFKGKGRMSKYGLPLDSPDDRHKWLFNVSQASRFLTKKSKEHGLRVKELFVTEKPRFFLKRWLRRLIYPSQKRYLNRYGHTLWSVLEK